MISIIRILCLVLFFQEVFCKAAVASDIVLRRQEILEHYFDYPAKKFNVPKALAMAIARQESGMNPFAVNVAGRNMSQRSKAAALEVAEEAMRRGQSFDVGLMQVNSWWIKRYNIPLEMLLDPANNVYVGCWILRVFT